MVQRFSSVLKCALLPGALLVGLAGSASAVTVGFDSDPTGPQPNGFQSSDSPLASFSAGVGTAVGVFEGSAIAAGHPGRVLFVPGGALINFAVPVSSLSLAVGNDEDSALP